MAEIINYNNISISLLLDMSIGIGGDKWPAADLFCQLITSNNWKEYFQILFQNKRCIELGSGTGILIILTSYNFLFILFYCFIIRNCWNPN